MGIVFEWVKYYSDFANNLLKYKNNRSELIALLQDSFVQLGMRYPFMDENKSVDDICPFTVMGCFNKGISDQNRIAIMSDLGKRIGVKEAVPASFDGIPVLNNLRAWFFGYKKDRQDSDIDHLWNLFQAAMQYADNPTEKTRESFVVSYDIVRKQNIIQWNITMGLYWIRANSYINLDAQNRTYLLTSPNYKNKIMAISSLKKLPDSSAYLDIIAFCKTQFEQANAIITSFPQLSHQAWVDKSSASDDKKSSASFLKWFTPLLSALKELGGSATPEQVRQQIAADLLLSDETLNETRGKNGAKKFDNEVAWARNYLAYEGYIDKSARGIWTLTYAGRDVVMSDELASDIFMKWVDILKERRDASAETSTIRLENEVRYWIYAPGDNASEWVEFNKNGIMAIGWDELSDLSDYPSRESIRLKMKEIYGQDNKYTNDSLATWQFANEIKEGDIVYAKKGLQKLLGRGIVRSRYYFDNNRSDYKSIRKVEWTHNGEWEHPGQAVMKTLTDITAYTEYVQKLESLFVNEQDTLLIEEKEVTYPSYTTDDFLDEVFIDESKYNKLVNILKTKKNLILQGAPGVGKTFIAKRLAFSIMGIKDTSRVSMVQFHQSYSYEDFVIGFRPTESGGFKLTPGPFYEFCKKAQDDIEQDYFFIIDEINRGNISKIFGELLMLIETDKRNEKLRLLYSNELFTVPKNVYIIGMMNTADRSLSLIDYALRRRFAFYEIEPAFDSVGFSTYIEECANEKLSRLIEQLKILNEYISEDESLGAGFRLGHSYLYSEAEISVEWVSSVLEHEILPLLQEYWFDDISKIEMWTKRLRGAIS